MDPTSSYHREKTLWLYVVTDVKLDCCGDHFVICAGIELYYIPETNIMLYVKLYLNFKKIPEGKHQDTYF